MRERWSLLTARMRPPQGLQALTVTAVALAALLRSGIASAQQCPLMAGARAALADHEPAARLEYIQRRLRNGASRSLLWAFGWGSAYASLATAQAVHVALTEDPTSRIEAGIAAAAGVLGSASIAIAPPAIIGDSRRLEAQVARMGPDSNVCDVLADAERYLLRDAEGAAFGVGWLLQSGAMLFNFAVGLAIGFALHDWTGGGISMATGIAVSELMFLTKPTDAVDAIRRYRAGDLRWTTARSTSYWVAAPDLAANRVGIRLQLVF